MRERSDASWRFGLAVALQLATLFYLPELAKWGGAIREAWQRFGIVAVAIACLLILAPVWRWGTLQQKLWAAILGVFPLLVLGGTLFGHLTAR